MNENYMQELVSDLIRDVNSNDAISEAGLKDTMFPDDLIAAIHNHLGNVNQLLVTGSVAFNSTDQFVAYESALKELDELQSNLFSAQQTDLISQTIYMNLVEKSKKIADYIADLSDPEYL